MCGDPAFEEPVFVFFPNGRIRAVCFDPNKAWWDPATEEPFLFFEGADHVPGGTAGERRRRPVRDGESCRPVRDPGILAGAGV
jgi:hypothetical protein